MAMFSGPEEHATNPPESWVVVKVAGRWRLQTADGGHLDGFRTKREAEEAKVSGFLSRLYYDEKHWYAGGHVAHWKPYAEVLAEQRRLAARYPSTQKGT